MVINTESKYTKKFTSDRLTKSKYDEIIDLAFTLRDHRNLVSSVVAKDLLFFMGMSKDKFLSYFLHEFSDLGISSNFYNNLYRNVFTCYESKFKRMKSKMRFELSSISKRTYYKKKAGSIPKGSIKDITFKKETTSLTSVLTFLAHYGSSTTVDYITTELNNTDLEEGKRELYKNVLDYITKFGYNRLMDLALLKRTNVLNKYNKPIEFNSLTFNGRSRKSDIITYNENRYSTIGCFISLSWKERNSCMQIPVKYNKEHYGDISLYHQNSAEYEYTVTFPGKGKVCVNLCIDGVRSIPVNELDDDKTIGIDVNTKHNLFTLSNEMTYDFDRELIDQICNELKKIDKLKSEKPDYKVGKKKQKKLDSQRNRYDHGADELVSKVCKDIQKLGINHVVLENLTNSFGKCYTEKDDINYNTFVKEVHLSSMKDRFDHIGLKYGIMSSFVQPEYTSKMCSKCGCIHDENRKTQEDFECVNCGFKINADLNAAINIKNRVVKAVLRHLLKQNCTLNSFRPKDMKRYKVKQCLTDSFPSSQVNFGVDVHGFV